MERQMPPSSTSAADAGSSPAERVMRVAPLDMRQQRFKTVFRGFDKADVVGFLTEAADDYELPVPAGASLRGAPDPGDHLHTESMAPIIVAGRPR